MVGGDVGRGSCGVLEGGCKMLCVFGGIKEMSVEEGFRDGEVCCTVQEAGGAVVLRGEDFPFCVLVCSHGNHLLRRGIRERD